MISVITFECSPEIEEEHISWLDNTHIPMILEFKGLKAVTEYKLVGETPPLVTDTFVSTTTEGYSEYMLILEFDNLQDFKDYESSPELAAAREEARTHDWRGLNKKKRRVQYEPVKIWKR